MKRKALIVGVLTTAMLSACGVNDNNMNDTALRNRDVTGPTGVNNPSDNRNFDINHDRNIGVRNNGNESSRMRVADKAADKIVSLKEVDSANVIVTDDNAYVAARLVNNNDNLTRDIERKIADQVKSADHSINDVYVSVNPDFYDRMATYSNDIRHRHPVEGFFDEFTETVRRIFPKHINK